MSNNGKNQSISLKPKWQDIFILLVALLIAIIFIIIFANGIFREDNGKYADIIYDGRVIKTVDLSVNTTLDLNFEYHNIIEVKNGKIGIISANCPDKTCVNSGFISKPGQIAVCVPSKLIIQINGKSNADAITK